MFPPSSPPPGPPKKKPSAEEKKSLWAKIIPWLFIVIGLCAIGTMIAINKKQPRLICRNVVHGPNSLTEMGSCTEE